jgi:hypothetical protein
MNANSMLPLRPTRLPNPKPAPARGASRGASAVGASSARLAHVRRLWFRLAFVIVVLASRLPQAAPAEASWHSLTGRLPVGTYVDVVRISPNSQHVVYLADSEERGQFELFSVPVTGGAEPVKLNGKLVSAGDVTHFAITPDSQYVIFTAAQEEAYRPDLYRVPITGGQAVKLNVAALAGRNVRDFAIDPDNVYVVYVAEQLVAGQFELFSVPILGGTVTRLNPNLVAGGSVARFQIDRFLDRVVYLADQEVNNREELFGVPIAGGTAVRLNPVGVAVYDFALNPQLQVVVFTAGNQLYMNVTTSGLLTTLNRPLAAGEFVQNFKISPNGARVAYLVTSGNQAQYVNLYSVLIGGGESAPLATATPGYDPRYATYEFTADSQRVIHRYQASTTAWPALRSVPAAGGNGFNLFTETASQSFSHMLLSPNGDWLVYQVSPAWEAFAVAVAGGATIPLGSGDPVAVMPDGVRLLMRSQAFGNADLLLVASGGGSVRNLSRTATYGKIGNVAVSPNGQWIVFVVEHASGESELRVSDGGEAPPVLFLPFVQR